MTLINDPEIYSRLRYGAESVDSEGRLSRPAPTTSTFRASVQPVDDTQVPDGLMREDITHRVYTSTELRPVDEDNGLPADEVVISGLNYRVVSAKYWRSLFGGQYKAWVSRVIEPGGPLTAFGFDPAEFDPIDFDDEALL